MVALAVTRHAPPLPVCSLDAPVAVFSPLPDRRVRSRSQSDHSRSRRLSSRSSGRRKARRDRERPATGHVTVAGLVTALLFLLTARGLGRRVGSLDGVAGIARRLLLLPAIAATLGRRQSPPLRLLVAPSLFPRPLSRTLSDCSSACLGPWSSGMRL